MERGWQADTVCAVPGASKGLSCHRNGEVHSLSCTWAHGWGGHLPAEVGRKITGLPSPLPLKSQLPESQAERREQSAHSAHGTEDCSAEQSSRHSLQPGVCGMTHTSHMTLCRPPAVAGQTQLSPHDTSRTRGSETGSSSPRYRDKSGPKEVAELGSPD